MHMEKLNSTLDKLNPKEDTQIEDLSNKKIIEQRYNSSRTLIDGQIKLLHNFLTSLDK